MPPKKGNRVKAPPVVSTDNTDDDCGFTFEEELAWCRKKLIESLALKHKDLKAAKPIVIALKTLDNKNNPLPKMRKMMRAGCGDYRKEMKEEYERAKAESKKISVSEEKEVKGTKVSVVISEKTKDTGLKVEEISCSDSSPFCFNFPPPEDKLSSDFEELKT